MALAGPCRPRRPSSRSRRVITALMSATGRPACATMSARLPASTTPWSSTPSTSAAYGRGLQCFGGGHAGLDHVVEFARVVAVRADTLVGAEADLHPALYALRERLPGSAHRSAPPSAARSRGSSRPSWPCRRRSGRRRSSARTRCRSSSSGAMISSFMYRAVLDAGHAGTTARCMPSAPCACAATRVAIVLRGLHDGLDLVVGELRRVADFVATARRRWR